MSARRPEMPLPVGAVVTSRLELIPASRELLVADLTDHGQLGMMLDAHIPVSWPSDGYDDGVIRFFIDQLDRSPNSFGWWSWYVILRDDDGDRTLVGTVGFKGVPAGGAVEIGYGIVDSYRRRGYGREAVDALIAWAFRLPTVTRVHAEALPLNAASLALLRGAGFVPAAEAARNPGHLRFVRSRE